MNKFEASNGYRVRAHAGGVLSVDDAGGVPMYHLGPYSVAALREHFQHERDEELGRWRWPENPDYVVYPLGDGAVEVIHEPGATTGYYYPDEPERFDSNKGCVARAYFEAQPKPWHDAKPGEVWEIQDASGTRIVFAHEDRTLGGVDGVTDNGLYLQFDAPEITAGRRVWPKESNDRA